MWVVTMESLLCSVTCSLSVVVSSWVELVVVIFLFLSAVFLVSDFGEVMCFNHKPEVFIRVNVELRINRCTTVDNEIISNGVNVELVGVLTKRDNDFVVDYIVNSGISGGYILFLSVVDFFLMSLIIHPLLSLHKL